MQKERHILILQLIVFLSILILVAMSACGRDIFVNNVKGNDDWDGSREKPFMTLDRAVNELRTSDTLYLVPTGFPYKWLSPSPQNRIRVGGTPEKHLVIDGQGTEITAFRRYGSESWKNEGNGVFSMPLNSNSWMRDGWWEGFDLVFFDGQPGKNCKLKAKLVPYGYVWFSSRLHDKNKADAALATLYIMLPEGKTPDDISVETGSPYSILPIESNYVTVKNLKVTWSWHDGFSSVFSKEIVYENVEAAYNMDQGMSHHSSVVIVRNSHFHHNAGAGIVDVRMNSKSTAESTYENCLIENDTYRGGVEFHDGVYRMKNCIIRNNKGDAVLIVNNPSLFPDNTKAFFENCLFEGGGAIVVRDSCSAEFINCTFYRQEEKSYSGQGLIFGIRALNSRIFQCAFINSPNIFSLPKITPGAVFSIDYNCYGEGLITVDNVRYQIPADLEKYRKETGLDEHSFYRKIKLEGSPYTLPELQGNGKDGADIGAHLNLERFNQYLNGQKK
ncbi:MAG: right-handed parallel beta-helix repeat-containing protein [Candidatus Omnitrophica bacterium]|nr:right-handed parallel beta-helix repeat-containing protein [Candidatus Omnitrophota bacterium]